MALFLSTYVNKLDKKGRLSVPALYRSALTDQSFQGIIVFRSHKYPCLEACGINRMEQISESLDDMDMFSDEQDDFAAAIFADAHQLAFDGQGRVVLPQDLADHANLTETAAIVGRGATFQIWEPDAFKAYQDEARARAKAKNASIKLRRKEGGDA